jgi:hypothetical protein
MQILRHMHRSRFQVSRSTNGGGFWGGCAKAANVGSEFMCLMLRRRPMAAFHEVTNKLT